MADMVKKPIYISKSISGLNARIDESPIKQNTKNGAVLSKTADKLFTAAEESYKNNDEERSYILFMRYNNIVAKLFKTPDYKKDKQYYDNFNFRKKFGVSLDLAEKLQNSLRDRYELKQKEIDQHSVIKTVQKSEKLQDKTESTELEFKETINSEELFNLIQRNIKLLLLDVRDADDFDSSRMKYTSCINIPPNILETCITSYTLQSKLPSDSSELWKSRSEAEYIVMLDWSSDSIKSKSVLDNLNRAMCIWDQPCKFKRTPILLKGGFEDWILHYPTFTTNPMYKHQSFLSEDNPSIPDLMDVQYPDLDQDAKLQEAKEHLKNRQNLFEVSQSNPILDRNVKPTNEIEKFDIQIQDLDTNTHVTNNHLVPGKNETTSTPVIKNSSVPAIRRELKPKSKNVSNSEENSVVENDVIRDPQDKDMIDNYKTLEDSYKEVEEKQLRLKEENAQMKLKLDEMQKESELLRDEDAKMKDILKTQMEDKMKLENEVIKEKSKSTLIEARTKKKPDMPVINQPELDTKVVKLKVEPETPPKSSSLSRSHSSPNIAKLVADEEKAAFRNQTPNFDRASKPKSREFDLLGYNKIQKLDVNSARQRNLMPVYGNKGPGLAGLKNLGNTCFMNSIIQCLANTIHLCFYFISGTFRSHINKQNKRGTRGELSEEFSVVLKSLWSNQYRSISPKDFKSKASKFVNVCVGYDQQDSHEFLTMMIEKLHQDVNTATVIGKMKPLNLDDMLQSEAVEAFWKNHKLLNQSVISELFEGLMCSTLQCLHCSKKSFSFEEFMCLSLPIPSSTSCTLKDCLQLFFKIERMSGEAKWFCPSCKTHRDAEKKIDICKLPKILIIHLKRFSYDGMWRRKLQTHVDFPSSNLNITTFIPGPDSRLQYTLYGVSNHYGTLEGGHYTAFCKNSVRNKWYRYDDHEVSEVSPNSVQSSAAYILFYSSLDQETPFINAFKKG